MLAFLGTVSIAFLRFLRAHDPEKIRNYRYIKDVFGEERCPEVCWGDRCRFSGKTSADRGKSSLPTHISPHKFF